MNRLRRLIEIGSDDQRTTRTAYVLRPETLPDPSPGFKWVEDSSFDAAEAVLVDAALKEVFSAAIADGYAMVDHFKTAKTAPQRTYKPKPSVYTVEVDGKPVVSFEAKSQREAQELIKEDWFLDDLTTLTAENRVLWDGKALIRARLATEAEGARYREIAAEAEEEGGDIVLAFLVTLDGPPRLR